MGPRREAAGVPSSRAEVGRGGHDDDHRAHVERHHDIGGGQRADDRAHFEVPVTTTTSNTRRIDRPRCSTTAEFKGIYEFAGDNSAADAGDPDLTGVNLIYYWSQIEPEKGVFDWSQIQRDMAPWIAAGKKVILRISTSGAASWDPPYSGDGTPAWVYADGARSISDNGETIPVYWDQAYLTDYRSFVQAFGAQFDGNPNVAFIQAGIGMGAETLPETNASSSGVAAWEADGYADPLWLCTVETIASFYTSAFRVTPVDALVDRTFFDGSGSVLQRVDGLVQGSAQLGAPGRRAHVHPGARHAVVGSPLGSRAAQLDADLRRLPVCGHLQRARQPARQLPLALPERHRRPRRCRLPQPGRRTDR